CGVLDHVDSIVFCMVDKLQVDASFKVIILLPVWTLGHLVLCGAILLLR
ncbi:hypothetical protein NFI96_030353, partial [Prochilodus magdalenae]